MKNKLVSLLNLMKAKNDVGVEQRMLEEIKERAKWLGVDFKYTNLVHTTGRFGIEVDDKLEVNVMEIEMRPMLPVQEQIIIIAHELGHVWQFLGECDANYIEWNTYLEINNELLIEEDAWLRGIKILHEVGFSDWFAFQTRAARAFATYVIKQYRNEKQAQEKVQSFVSNLSKQIEKEVRTPALV